MNGIKTNIYSVKNRKKYVKYDTGIDFLNITVFSQELEKSFLGK